MANRDWSDPILVANLFVLGTFAHQLDLLSASFDSSKRLQERRRIVSGGLLGKQEHTCS